MLGGIVFVLLLAALTYAGAKAIKAMNTNSVEDD
jgi:hypothetical protein